MCQKYFFVEGSSSPSTATNHKKENKSSTKCRVCKNTIERGQLRIARLVPRKNDANANKMKQLWHHVDCIFQGFRCDSAFTVKITDPVVDIEGWNEISEQDKTLIAEKVAELQRNSSSSSGAVEPERKNKVSVSIYPFSDQDPTLFSTFSTLCACLEAEPKKKKKSEIVSNYMSKIKRNEESDTAVLVVRMLLSKIANTGRLFNLTPNILMRIFSKIFTKRPSMDLLKEEFKQTGDVSTVIGNAYVNEHAGSNNSRLSMKSSIPLREMDEMIFELSLKGEEREQLKIAREILNKLRSHEEVIYFIRLAVGNLRIKAGVKEVLDGVGVGAYDVFCTNQDIKEAVLVGRQTSSFPATTAAPRVFVPVMPMLAQSFKSSAAAVKKIGRGDGRHRLLYSEIKYGGERVQIHMFEKSLVFFSRALKMRVVGDMKEYLLDAFPEAKSFILDAEVCKETGSALEKNNVVENCVFVFDVLLYNGESMLNKPLSDRRALLERIMIEQKNRVVLSELVKIKNNGKEELDDMLQRDDGLVEGLMVKDAEGKYEPGKRHWLMIKKDLNKRTIMANTADLVVLGAWYGKGRKKELLSTFLMGCLDKRTGQWKTVTKAHTGLDDATLQRLQDELKAIMVKSGKEEEKNRSFMLVKSSDMKPDYIVKDPEKAPVWELTWSEFTKFTVSSRGGRGRTFNYHTAGGDLSIRFPRITREKKDKNWETATSEEELEGLYEAYVKSMEPAAAVTKPSEVAAEAEAASTSGQGEQQEVTTIKRAREEGEQQVTMTIKRARVEEEDSNDDKASQRRRGAGSKASRSRRKRGGRFYFPKKDDHGRDVL